MSGEHVRYLRGAAKRLREVAAQCKTELSETLNNLADEFEAKAAEIEAGSGCSPAVC